MSEQYLQHFTNNKTISSVSGGVVEWVLQLDKKYNMKQSATTICYSCHITRTMIHKCIFHRIPVSDTQELIQSKISVLRSKRFEPSAAEPHPAMTVYRIVYFYCLYSSSEARSARLPDSKTLIETWSFMMMYLTRSLVINTHLPSKQNVKFFVFNR